MTTAAWTEREVIKEIMEFHEEKEVDEIWFVVSAKWWTQWKEYVRYGEDGDDFEASAQRPDMIDNTPLVAGLFCFLLHQLNDFFQKMLYLPRVRTQN